MSAFIKKKIDNDINLYLYSERGKLDLLYHYYLNSLHKFSILLESCTNKNDSLGGLVSGYKSFTLFSEFDLGKEGFGSPDGCIVTDNGFVIFIEGKNIKFQDSLKLPNKGNIKGFNSSINGQIELRWRFINAFLHMQGDKISERNILLDEYKEFDVFYENTKRKAFETSNDAKYRRLADKDLLKDISEIFKNISIEKVFFLVVTKDTDYPEHEINKIRLIDYASKNSINNSEKVFHFNIDKILELCNAC